MVSNRWCDLTTGNISRTWYRSALSRHVWWLIHEYHDLCRVKQSLTALVLARKGNPVFERFQGAVVDCLLELARKIKHHHRLVSVRKEDVTHTGRGDVDGFQVSTDVLGKPRFAIIPYRIHHEQYCPGTLRLKHIHACDLPRSQSNLRRCHRLTAAYGSVVVASSNR